MSAENLEHSYGKLKKEVQLTHDFWDDWIWQFIYTDGISEIEKIVPQLSENMNEVETSLKKLVNEINSI